MRRVVFGGFRRLEGDEALRLLRGGGMSGGTLLVVVLLKSGSVCVLVEARVKGSQSLSD